MATALDARVLVLSKSWIPIDTTTVFEALKKVMTERARIVAADYSLYGMDEWIDNWGDAKKIAELAEEKIIHAVNFNMAIPEVIVTTEYNGFFMKKAKLSRNAIFARDNYECQYCGKHYKKDQMNIDHIIPRSKGGKTIWTNLVLSCISCNCKKGNMLLEDVGMKLRRKPFQPHWSMVKNKKAYNNIPKSWEEFLGKLYWDISLTD
ncbi:MAG: HNH endonuclease [Lentisphaeria bacterium]|nr:HNH endonuclease [Lentisphaeria bacterium]NQZ70619.1 HNH endonuclease [Lentisphaeria bacterium]